MKKLAIRGAALAATGVLAATAFAGTANADTFMKLPNDSVRNGAVTVSVTNQSAVLSPSMVALPTSRNAWVSGTVSVKVDGKASGGSIRAGYLVGCQIDVGSAKVVLGGDAQSGATYTMNEGPSVAPSVSGTTGGAISLKAGSVGTQYLTWDRATMPEPGDEVTPNWANPTTSFKFKGGSGSLSYADRTIGVDGCAGYAQARFFAQVKATTGDTARYTVLWGQPFTLG